MMGRVMTLVPEMTQRGEPDAAAGGAQILDHGNLIRLVPCPRCAYRGRTIHIVGNVHRGRCLTCGGHLSEPLAVEAV